MPITVKAMESVLIGFGHVSWSVMPVPVEEGVESSGYFDLDVWIDGSIWRRPFPTCGKVFKDYRGRRGGLHRWSGQRGLCDSTPSLGCVKLRQWLVDELK